eukprot:TRINITY_DN405_c0_g7_i1.p3 TRINITY_DN405_c0_g7~~TRINITY_DN405_c0_g7_i1.p3  ORF type:complete len:137 (-),score=30.05 TRINITY_DN405_c0_g7_i1:337-747(-)
MQWIKYKKEEDTNYYDDVSNNNLQKTTQYSKKYCLVKDRMKYSFLSLDNARFGDFNIIDYNGKKAIVSKATHEYDDKTKMDEEILYDAETGMIMKDEQKSFNSYGEMDMYVSDNYTIKRNQTFDEGIFNFGDDKNY